MEAAKFLASVFSFLSIFLAIYAQSVEPNFLKPNYDSDELELKVFKITQPLVLNCNITKPGNFTLKWEKNGTDVENVKELVGRYKIINEEHKFIINKTIANDDGQYSCVVEPQRRNFNVVAELYLRVPSNSYVVEGEKVSIVCIVAGTNPQLSWAIGNRTISQSEDPYILKPDDKHVKNAILSIENASLDHRGEYKCIGRNEATGHANSTIVSDVSFLRVKGKYAALWPFFGICAEVLILCAIILIYEKRRNKSELEESDTDPQDQKKKRRNFE